MSYDEDEDTYYPANVPMKISIEGDAAIQREVMRGLRHHFSSEVAKQVEEAIRDLVASEVESQVKALSEEIVRPLIVRAVEEGWPRTNQYGEAMPGGNIGIKERVSGMLNERDRYSDRGTWIERIAKDVIEKELRGNFGKEIDVAKEKLRRQFDDEVQGRFLKVIREGLGLPR